MRLAIVGGRDFNNYNEVKIWGDMFRRHLHIISGGANGADALAKKYAIERFLPYIEFPAEWYKYGKSAGFIRNQTIVDNCDMVLAFWDGESRGTADTIEKAKRAKKPTFIVYY